MLTLKRALGLVALVNLSFFALLIVYNTRTHSSARNKFSNLNANVDMLKAAADLPFSEFSDELDIYISLTDDPNEIPQRYISPKKNTENTENTEQGDTEEKEQIVPYNALRELGAYKSPSLEYFNDFPKAKPRYKTKYMGIKHNKHYCDFVDTINLEHPENVNEKMNFVGDYIPTSLVKRIVFKELGRDVMPQCYMGVTKGSFDMDTTANAFYMKSVVFHHYYEIGSNFKCASQIYGHVPGSGVLTRKDLVVGSVNDYAKRYEDKPQCFNKEMYFPYAYRLYNKTECLQFFEEIDSPKYAKLKEVEPFSFLLKAGYGAHRGQGIKMLDANEEQKVREEYRNGEMCGEIKKSHVAQKYIPNPLLLDLDNKFDFRMYMLIASVDPFIVFYHDGFLRVSLGTYDKDSKERSVHFTNTHLSKAKFAQAKNGKMYNGMNETELRDYQMWKMEDLQDYLLEIGKIDNDRWLDEYLRPKFKEAFIHTVRMAEHAFFKLPGAFEMFGLDFLLDENLNLWFIECNASPQLIGTNDFKTEFLTKMLKDMFEIQYAYLRSRWQRIRVFVEKFNKAMETDKDKVSLPMWQEEFAKINKDRLEPEYKISDNSWNLIMDKNIKGKGAYLGLLREECIDDEDL